MTAEEFHQQQLEEQQDIERLRIRAKMSGNHGKFVAIARFVRDNPEEFYVKVAIKSLLEALEEHDVLEKKEKEVWNR